MFNIHSTIRDVAVDNPGIAPESLAGLVWGSVPTDEYEHLAWAQVKNLCRDHIGNERRRPVTADDGMTIILDEFYTDDSDLNLTSAAPTKAKVKSSRGRVADRVRKDLKAWLDDGFYIAGIFRVRATLTVDDLMNAASERRDQSARNLHWAEIYETQAKMLESSGAATVGDLDDDSLRAMAEVEK